MINKIEQAKSGRSSCAKCKNKIPMNEWRGIEPTITSLHGRTYKSNKFYCKDCTIIKLKKSRESINGWLSQLEQNTLL